MKNNTLVPLIIASLSLIISTAVSADDQNGNNKKGENKKSEAQPHPGKVMQQAAPRAAAPQRQQVARQAAPRAVSQQVNQHHENMVTRQSAQVSHAANQEARPQSAAVPRIVSQNSQSGVSVSQNRETHKHSAQVVASQQGVNGGSVRSPRQSSVAVVSPQSQSANGGGGSQQYQVTPNAQYNGNNNYGGLWTQANTHNDWSHDGQHYWNNHNYRWYQGGWLIIDGFFNPFYSNGNVGYSNSGYNGSSMASSVQSRLNQLGYYNGPIDGDLGPGSRNAIANYQRDNNLYVNGRINNNLLQSLQLL